MITTANIKQAFVRVTVKSFQPNKIYYNNAVQVNPWAIVFVVTTLKIHKKESYEPIDIQHYFS